MKYLICIIDFIIYTYIDIEHKDNYCAFLHLIYEKERDRKLLPIIINKSLNGNLTV